MANFDEYVNLLAIMDLEEAEQLEHQPGRAFHERDDPFETLSDNNFVREYRLNKGMVEQLVNMLEAFIPAETRNSALSVKTKVLITLHFFAYGGYQYSTGRTVNTAVAQASVSRAIKEVTDAMNTPEIFRYFVIFPNTMEKLRQIQMGFFNNYGFPGVIGAIDCTQVAIIAPKSDDPLYPEALYINRKGYHSINVQLICDSDLKILNVCAQYPGSTNDAFIWNNCEINDLLQNLHRNGHRSLLLLVGDSGYPLRPWLLTPLNEIPQPNTTEERYNNCHKSARSTIERCNGLLKSRFRCLLKHRVLHYHPERASKIINCCVMLHNFCLENNLPPPHNDGDNQNWDFGILQPHPDEDEIQNRANPELIAGRRVRNEIIRNYFT